MLTGYLITTQNTLKSMTRYIIERNISQKKKSLNTCKNIQDSQIHNASKINGIQE